MKQSTKQKRALEKLAELTKKYGGGEINVTEAQSYMHQAAVSESEKLEGVLASLRRPGDYTYRRCKRESCGAPFGANYRAVAYCSDVCRIRDFEATTGIKWNGNKSPEERWGGEPPVVITPDVLATMLPYAERLIQEFHRLGMTKQELTAQIEASKTPDIPEHTPEETAPEVHLVTNLPESPRESMTFGTLDLEEVSFLSGQM